MSGLATRGAQRPLTLSFVDDGLEKRYQRRRRPRGSGWLPDHHHRLGRGLGDGGCSPASFHDLAACIRERRAAGRRRRLASPLRCMAAVGADARPPARPGRAPDVRQRHRDPGAGPHRRPAARLRRGRHDGAFRMGLRCRGRVSSTQPGALRSWPSASPSQSRSTTGPYNLTLDVLLFAAAAVGTLLGLRILERNRRRLYFGEMLIREQSEQLQIESEKSERLLLNILPAPIAGRLKDGEETIADEYQMVSVLFADIVGFTPLSARLRGTRGRQPAERPVLCLRRPGSRSRTREDQDHR